MNIKLHRNYILQKLLSAVRLLYRKITSFKKQSSKPSFCAELALVKEWFDLQDKSPCVLILGDSTMERISNRDTDRRPLGQMISDLVNDKLPTKWLSHSAYQTVIFHGLLRSIRTLPGRPKLLVFPINLRVFSPQWHCNPMYQFREELEAIDSFIESGGNHITDITTAIKYTDYTEYDLIEINCAGSSLKNLGEYRQIANSKPVNDFENSERYRQLFACHYGYTLESSHPKLTALTDLVLDAIEMGIFIYTYITPVNVEAGQRYAGQYWIDRLRCNCEIIQKIVQKIASKEHIILCDYSNLLGSNYYFHKNDPTEHLNQYGRSQLAKLVATNVLNTLPAKM